jgi:2-polyprenyl-6-methoxyphenol hydroxylase-like FAD-dependent oxidoreductase
MLLGVMPALARVLGGFEITGKVQMRTNHLPRAEHVRRDGVVLIGDAFQTSCPAAGTGSGRLLTDVETLLACHPGGIPYRGEEADRRLDTGGAAPE